MALFMMKNQIHLYVRNKIWSNTMLYLKISYGDVIKIVDSETGKAIAALTMRGIESSGGIDTSRRYIIEKTLLKQQFSFDDE